MPYILSISGIGLRGEILLHMANDKGLIVGTGSACSSNAKSRYRKRKEYHLFYIDIRKEKIETHC